LLSKVTDLMVKLQAFKGARDKNLNMVADYLSRHKVSHKLSAQVQYHCQFVLAVELTEEKVDEALRILPRHLKIEVVMETRAPKIIWHGLFAACRKMSQRYFERFLCDKLSQIFTESDELIFSSGERANNAYFTDMGRVHYSAVSKVLQSLRPQRARRASFLELLKMAQESSSYSLAGAYKRMSLSAGRCVAEPGLWCKWVHSGCLRSDTRTTLLSANIREFATLAKFYPGVEQLSVIYAREFVLTGQRCADIMSDLFDFTKLRQQATIQQQILLRGGSLDIHEEIAPPLKAEELLDDDDDIFDSV